MSHVKVGGAWKELASGSAVKVSGAWKDIKEIHVKVSGAWKLAWTDFTASADDPTPSGNDSDFAACGSVTSSVCTITPSGGKAPYTYAWTQQGTPAQNGPYSCNAPSSNATNWSSNPTVCDGDIPSSETWRCTVTDDNSKTVTVDVVVDLIWTDLS